MSNSASTAERTLEVLARVAESDQVRKDPQLQLYATQVMDSLKTVELIVALGQEFGLDISPSEFDPEAWATPEMVVRFVEERVGM
jgi:D-alanine--poly(phosphoribitol) ligase subunit 2